MKVRHEHLLRRFVPNHVIKGDFMESTRPSVPYKAWEEMNSSGLDVLHHDLELIQLLLGYWSLFIRVLQSEGTPDRHPS